MAWIEVIEPAQSDGRLKTLFDTVIGSGGDVDNILSVHSLRPHSLGGHMALYRSVMHHSSNVLPKPLRESIGLYVSILNKCQYCIAHHHAALERLVGDKSIADRIFKSLDSGTPECAFANGALAAMNYARILTLTPADVSEPLVLAMRHAGLDDGKILEVNQIVSYFAYANRVAQGLGVETDSVLGLESGALDSVPG